EIARHVGKSQDAVDGRHVERAVPEGQPARHVETGGQHVHAALAVAVDDGEDLAFGERADEDDAGRAERHLAGVGDVAGVDGDVEAGRQRDVAHLGGGAGQHTGQVAPIPAADAGHADDGGDDEGDHDVQATHGRASCRERV